MSLEIGLARALAIVRDTPAHRFGISDAASRQQEFARIVAHCQATLEQNPKPDRMQCEAARTSALLLTLAASPLETKVKKAATQAGLQFLKSLNEALQETFFVSTESTLMVEIIPATNAVTVSYIVGDDIVVGEGEGAELVQALAGTTPDLARLFAAIERRADCLVRFKENPVSHLPGLGLQGTSALGVVLPGVPLGYSLRAALEAPVGQPGFCLVMSLWPLTRMDAETAALACTSRFKEARQLRLNLYGLDAAAKEAALERRVKMASELTAARCYRFSVVPNSATLISIGRFECANINDQTVLDDACAYLRQRAALSRVLESCLREDFSKGAVVPSENHNLDDVDVRLEGRPGLVLAALVGGDKPFEVRAEATVEGKVLVWTENQELRQACQRVWDECASFPAIVHLCCAVVGDKSRGKKRAREST